LERPRFAREEILNTVGFVTCGPTGGSGGNFFIDDFPADGVSVAQILVWHGDYIDAIQLQYSDGSATSRHGGGGGNLTTFTLGPEEFIAALTGDYGDYVDSLTIHTNQRTFPLVGGYGGNKPYIYSLTQNGEVIGFFGASGGYVDALGIIGRERTPI
jgi:hypothetical protein